MEVIEMVKELRRQEMTLQGIADLLNSTGVSTKSRRAKWAPTTVWLLLKR
jgi:hypothetical protein